MKKFYVMWTYVANYGGPWEREGKSAEDVGLSVVRGFSDDFAERCKVFVFESMPSFVYEGSKS